MGHGGQFSAWPGRTYGERLRALLLEAIRDAGKLAEQEANVDDERLRLARRLYKFVKSVQVETMFQYG